VEETAEAGAGVVYLSKGDGLLLGLGNSVASFHIFQLLNLHRTGTRLALFPHTSAV
jgi:hypothetical protein